MASTKYTLRNKLVLWSQNFSGNKNVSTVHAKAALQMLGPQMHQSGLVAFLRARDVDAEFMCIQSFM